MKRVQYAYASNQNWLLSKCWQKKCSHQRHTVIVEDVLIWLQVERILHWTIRANADSHHDIGHSCCPSVRKPITHSLWLLNIHPKEQATKQKMQETNYHHPLIIEQANNKPPNKGNDPPCLTSWPQIEEHFTNNGFQFVTDASVYDPSLREMENRDYNITSLQTMLTELVCD